MSSGYGYDNSVSSPGQYQHEGMAHSGTFDPNLIHQYPHTGQQQQQLLQQQQGLPLHRHNHRRHSDKSVHLDYQVRVIIPLYAVTESALVAFSFLVTAVDIHRCVSIAFCKLQTNRRRSTFNKSSRPHRQIKKLKLSTRS